MFKHYLFHRWDMRREGHEVSDFTFDWWLKEIGPYWYTDMCENIIKRFDK